MEEIFIRRSIRKFENRPVEKEKTDKILRAGMQAPSAGNQQPWEFIVVEDKDELQQKKPGQHLIASKASGFSGQPFMKDSHLGRFATLTL